MFFLHNFDSSNFFCHGSGAQTVQKYVYLTKKNAQLQKRLVSNIFLQKTYFIILREFRSAVVDTYLVLLYTVMAGASIRSILTG